MTDHPDSHADAEALFQEFPTVLPAPQAAAAAGSCRGTLHRYKLSFMKWTWKWKDNCLQP